MKHFWKKLGAYFCLYIQYLLAIQTSRMISDTRLFKHKYHEESLHLWFHLKLDTMWSERGQHISEQFLAFAIFIANWFHCLRFIKCESPFLSFYNTNVLCFLITEVSKEIVFRSNKGWNLEILYEMKGQKQN